MWVKSYSKIYPNVKREDIWRIWEDVNNWPKWDRELEFCKMEGKFTAGNQFILKPAGGPKVNIMISEVLPNQGFTDYCKFLGATMYDVHTLEDTPEGVKVTNTIRVTGPLKFIWVNLVAKNVAKSVPVHMDALVELARST